MNEISYIAVPTPTEQLFSPPVDEEKVQAEEHAQKQAEARNEVELRKEQGLPYMWVEDSYDDEGRLLKKLVGYYLNELFRR